MNRITRRRLLTGASALAAMTGLPASALAQAAPTDRKFLFVFNLGGWDPTRVFATEFSNPNVDMEPDADPWTVGGLQLVDHPSRPSVRSFFQEHAAQALVLNGLLVRSIAHEICAMIAMTGSSSGLDPDWPARLASARADRYTLPHLVLAGPSYPGDLGTSVARTGVNGQLENLLSGRALQASDQPVRGPNAAAEAIVDRYLLRRGSARADFAHPGLDEQLTRAWIDSHEKATALKDLQYIMDFSAGADLASQAEVAVEALSLGMSRCVTLQYPGVGQFSWDTHANNDADQATLWEGLFQGLSRMMALLRATPGESKTTLAEETVVVVLSEMGRTPLLNGAGGKDHWPYTSAMLLGPGVSGGRVIGGYDAGYYGRLINPITGEPDDNGQALSAEALGATLLQLADLDPAEAIPGIAPITAALT